MCLHRSDGVGVLLEVCALKTWQNLSVVITGAWWAAKTAGLKGVSATWWMDNDRPACQYVPRSNLLRGHYHSLRPRISQEWESWGKRKQRRPWLHGKGSGGGSWVEEASEDMRLPRCRMELISPFHVLDSKYLASPTVAPDPNLWPALGLWR